MNDLVTVERKYLLDLEDKLEKIETHCVTPEDGLWGETEDGVWVRAKDILNIIRGGAIK